MKPYSKEFRGQVLAACDKGRSTREVATYFEVSESWVRRIKQERRELNKTAPLLERQRTPGTPGGHSSCGQRACCRLGPQRSEAAVVHGLENKGNS